MELRDRLLRAVIAVVRAASFRARSSPNQLFTLVAMPLIEKMPKGTSMIATSLISPFMAPLKLALFVALFIAMPYVLYQAWAFVAPGLYKHEKRFAMPLVVSSIVLFYAGVAFAYFVVFPLMFAFLTTTAPTGVQVMTDIAELSGLRAAAVLRVRHRLRDAGRHRAARRHRAGARRDHDQEPRLRDPRASSSSRRSSRRPMRCRRSLHGRADVPAVRGRHHPVARSCCRNAWRSSAAKSRSASS